MAAVGKLTPLDIQQIEKSRLFQWPTSEEANRFAYRGQVLRRAILRGHGEYGRLVVSLASDLLADYGYILRRSIFWYVGVIAAAALAYYALDPGRSAALDWHLGIAAVAESVTAFHGRGIFSGSFASDEPRSIVAAIEAVFGLSIEICLIVTFSQRFFEK